MPSRGTSGNLSEHSVSNTTNGLTETTSVGVTGGFDIGGGIPGLGGWDIEVSLDKSITGLDVSTSFSVLGLYGTVGFGFGFTGMFGAVTYGKGFVAGQGYNFETVFDGTRAVVGYSLSEGNLTEVQNVDLEVSSGFGIGTITSSQTRITVTVY